MTKYLNEKEVSAITGRSISSLRHDRIHSAGIPYIKIPGQRRVYYDEADVHGIMQSNKVKPRACGSCDCRQENRGG